MISADFYPSAWMDGNVQGYPTQLVQSIPITTPEFTQAYWLGWVAWENIPQQYKISRYKIENGKGIFTDVTKAENVPIGYNVNDDGSYVPAKMNAAILTNNGEKWQNITYPNHTTTAGNNVRLPNSLNVNTVGYNGVVILGFVGYANTTEISGWVSIGINNFINDSDFTVTFTNGYVFTAKPSDFNEYTLTEFDVNDVHYKIALGMYKIDYIRDVTIYGSSYGYQGIHPMLQTHTTDDKAYIQSLTYPVHYQNNNTFNWGSGETGQGAYIDFNGNVGTGMVQNTDGENVDIIGGFVGEFDITSMVSNGIIHPENATFYIRGIGRSDLAIIGRIFTYTEIYKSLALAPRISVAGVNLYANNANFYYAKVDLETNEFLTEFVSGDKTAELTDWQIIGGNINNDEFTEDDIPEYEPPGPPGGEPDEGARGVPIPLSGNTPPRTEFLHQAAFPVATIQSLASQLWNQPDNFWQKIVAATSENPMDYFISLRYYPLTFEHGDGQNVLHIGRGGELSLGSNYYPVYPVESFNFGTVTIQRQYNNFLDYAPYTAISIFLPYAGTFELNPTIVMGRTLKLWLDVDCTDGSGVWTVYNQTDSQPVLIKQCRIAAEIPLSGIDASQMAANIINASLQTAQHALGIVKTDVTSKAGIAGQAIGGNLEGAAIGAVGTAFNGPQTILTGLGDAYNLAQASKEIPQYSGGSTGAAACSANNTPYIIYRRPLCTNPENFAHAVGYLSNKTALISSLSGFTSCRNVDVSGIGQATDKEKAQIKQILESGFYA